MLFSLLLCSSSHQIWFLDLINLLVSLSWEIPFKRNLLSQAVWRNFWLHQKHMLGFGASMQDVLWGGSSLFTFVRFYSLDINLTSSAQVLGSQVWAVFTHRHAFVCLAVRTFCFQCITMATQQEFLQMGMSMGYVCNTCSLRTLGFIWAKNAGSICHPVMMYFFSIRVCLQTCSNHIMATQHYRRNQRHFPQQIKSLKEHPTHHPTAAII